MRDTVNEGEKRENRERETERQRDRERETERQIKAIYLYYGIFWLFFD